MFYSIPKAKVNLLPTLLLITTAFKEAFDVTSIKSILFKEIIIYVKTEINKVVSLIKNFFLCVIINYFFANKIYYFK